MIRSHLVGVGRIVGGAVVCAAAIGLPVAPARAADQVAAPSAGPDPAAAQLAPPVGPVGGGAGLYAIGGGLVVVAGGAALWLRRKKTGQVTIH